MYEDNDRAIARDTANTSVQPDPYQTAAQTTLSASLEEVLAHPYQTAVQTTLSASIEKVLVHSEEIKGMLGLSGVETKESVSSGVIEEMLNNIEELNENLLSIKQKLERL